MTLSAQIKKPAVAGGLFMVLSFEVLIMATRQKEVKGKLPCMPLWVNDFLGSGRVQEMSGLGRSTYLMLLALEWNAKGRGLPTENRQLIELLRYTKRQWEAVKEEVLLMFSEQDGRMYNARCEEEIAKAHTKAGKAAKAAKRRWGDDANAYANALRTHSERNATHTHTLDVLTSTLFSSSSPSVRDGEKSQGGGKVDFSNLNWEREEDAVAEALRSCRERDRIGVYTARLIVRNALDCWARRNKLKSARATFISRARKGKAALEKSGAYLDDRAAEIVTHWTKEGTLRA